MSYPESRVLRHLGLENRSLEGSLNKSAIPRLLVSRSLTKINCNNNSKEYMHRQIIQDFLNLSGNRRRGAG